MRLNVKLTHHKQKNVCLDAKNKYGGLTLFEHVKIGGMMMK